MVKHVEGVCSELHILLAPCGEVLEDRHVYPVVSGPVDRILSAAQEVYGRRGVRNGRGILIGVGLTCAGICRARSDAGRRNQISSEWIGKGARVIPVVPCPGFCRASHIWVGRIWRSPRGEGVTDHDRPRTTTCRRADVDRKSTR